MSKEGLFAGPKQVEFDQILPELFVAKRNKGIAIFGPMLIAKAKSLKEELNITEDMKFSKGWLRSFKSRTGIRQLTVSGEQQSADIHRESNYCDKFKMITADYGLMPDNIYNTDESGVNWKCLPTKMLARSEEQKIKGFKLNKERLTVMVCANASGNHKLKLLVIGKSKCPQALKGISPLLASYYSSKNGWVNQQLFKECFLQEFVPVVQRCFCELGKSDSKCLLSVGQL